MSKAFPIDTTTDEEYLAYQRKRDKWLKLHCWDASRRRVHVSSGLRVNVQGGFLCGNSHGIRAARTRRQVTCKACLKLMEAK